MVEEDIISTLPDALLCHILSFLQTGEANVTTILSKRWKNLWLSVPSLYFNNKWRRVRGADCRFNDFVYSVLLSRDPALPIKTFRLKLVYNYPEPHCPSNSIPIWIKPHCLSNSIPIWINFVVPRGVEYLRLYFDILGLAKLPISILTCKTLVVLKLFGFDVCEGFSSVMLPSLKTLHLKRIRFFELRDFILFLKGCPILENLLTYDVPFDREESLTSEEWKSFCLSNLTQANIDCAGSYFPLKAVHNVSSLSLEFDKDRCCNDFLPTFHNLTQLKLISLKISWKFLVEVLNHCPKLQKLDLDPADVQSETWTDDKEKFVDSDVVPQCLSLHLRTCNLFNFIGMQGELMLAWYILKNAKVLQTMKIWKCRQPGIERKLSSRPRASSTCEIIVYYNDS